MNNRAESTDLTGRTAIVTGGGRGIFRAVAIQMAAAGANVVVVDTGGAVGGGGSDVTVADDTVSEIRAQGGSAVACTESVTTLEGATKIATLGMEAFGRLDILVNGAGIVRMNMIWDMPEADFDALIETHLKGTWNCMRAVIPAMMEAGSGAIINTSSSVGVDGFLANSNYAAAKAGVIGLTFAAALDLGPLGIRVNAICPTGYSRMIAMDHSWRSCYPADWFSISPEQAPPEAVAPLAVYLATDAASDVNGQLFDSGGGVIGWYPRLVVARQIHPQSGVVFTLDELARRAPDELLGDYNNPAPRQDGPDRHWPLTRLAGGDAPTDPALQ